MKEGTGQALYRRAKQLIPGGTQLLSKRPELFLPGFWPAYYSKAKGVEVFDLDGNFLRSFGGNVIEEGGMMGSKWVWHGKFVKVQSLAMDSNGYLHALDTYMNNVQILLG